MRQYIWTAAICAFAIPTLGRAEQAYSCLGDNPAWTLKFDASSAHFQFLSLTEMDVVLDTPAEGLDWPRALTLIGDRDTAIVVLEQEICSETMHYRAHVMTQRGQTPILLTGCCTVTE